MRSDKKNPTPSWRANWLVLPALLFFFFATPVGFAEERTKQLNFDDEVIEAVNKQSNDSLTQLSQGEDGKAKVHLYEKRSGFEEENLETLRELTEDKK